MKMKTVSVLSLIIVTVFLITSCSLLESDVDKAKEFMDAGMYPQAMELLSKRINDKPSDAEAHFLMGACYINTGNYGGADDRFGSAVQLKSDYGYQIGGEYKKAGSTALNKNQVRKAEESFTKAIQYQPDLKGALSQEAYALVHSIS